jgi:hypothetical protein
MSYGLLLGKVGDHFVNPYAEHITKITGIEIVAEKLGLIRRQDDGEIEAAPVAQTDHDGDGVPSSAPVGSKPGYASGAATKVGPAATAPAPVAASAVADVAGGPAPAAEMPNAAAPTAAVDT